MENEGKGKIAKMKELMDSGVLDVKSLAEQSGASVGTIHIQRRKYATEKGIVLSDVKVKKPKVEVVAE